MIFVVYNVLEYKAIYGVIKTYMRINQLTAYIECFKIMSIEKTLYKNAKQHPLDGLSQIIKNG